MAAGKRSGRPPRRRRKASNPLKKRAPKGVRKPKKRAPRKKKAPPEVKLSNGKQACDRCHKREPKHTTWVDDWGRYKRTCEGCHDTEWRERTLRHAEATARELMVMDEIRDGDSFLVEQFIRQRLGQLDLSSAVVYVTLREDGALRKNLTSVKHHFPDRPAGRGSKKWRPWLEVKVGRIAKHKAEFPHAMEVNIGTKKIDDEVAVVLMRKDWYFETEDVELADMAEALAFGAGEGLHKILVRMKQVAGRQVGTEARRYAIRFLADFRRWRRGRGAPSQETLGFGAAAAAG